MAWAVKDRYQTEAWSNHCHHRWCFDYLSLYYDALHFEQGKEASQGGDNRLLASDTRAQRRAKARTHTNTHTNTHTHTRKHYDDVGGS